MGKINELPPSSARLLTSSQIISSVYCVVKELIENALDSGAKNVEVKLEDYGIDKIEVKDNGCGIEKSDIQYIAKPHYTSKITSYSDLHKIETYGFRGEALGAICAVADLIITTRSSVDSIGCTVSFSHDGINLSSKMCSCPQGTTVSVVDLFKNIPVRRQFYRFEKNKKEELRKVEDLLISYGIIQNDVRFVLYHNRNLIWQKIALSSVTNALIQTFGNAVFDHMKHVEYLDDETQLKIEMYLPKPDAPLSCGFNSANKSIFSVNKRPVRIKGVEKLLKKYYNESIKNSGKARYPICYITFFVPPLQVDVNVEPNKTSVMLNDYEEILEKFSGLLKDFYNFNLADNNFNMHVPIHENLSSIPKQISNTENFLECLKMNCDARFQQSKLEFDKNNASNICDGFPLSSCTIVKKDKSEPCKKKIRTSLKKSKEFENHVNTLKEFYSATEKGGDKPKTSLSDSICAVVKRVQSGVGNESTSEVFQTSGSHNSIDSNNITAFSASNALICDKVNGHPVSSQDKGHFAVNPISFTGNNSEQEKNITPALSSNNFNNRSTHPVPSQDKDPSVNPVTSVKSNFNAMQENSSIIVQNEASWSRGMHPSGEVIQPVAVLQPKTAIKVSANSPKKATNALVLKTSSPNQASLPFDRKLTSFDIFCRSNRLEVAAQNPSFNNCQIAQILSEKWSHLSSDEKAVYKNMLHKDYPKIIKNKNSLGKTISENLNQDKKNIVMPKKSKKKFALKSKTEVTLNMEKIKKLFSLNRLNSCSQNLQIINSLVSGIWICAKEDKLYLLNSFRLQETLIYHRLLATFYFEIEPANNPINIPLNHLGEDAMAVLLQLNELEIDINGSISDERIIANGFKLKLIKGENGQVSIEMLGIANCNAFYGISDLKELLLLIKEKGISAKLSECRPAKICFYLQSEATRMSRQSPACQRLQDVQDLLREKNKLLPNINICLHQKPFFHEVYCIDRNQTLNANCNI